MKRYLLIEKEIATSRLTLLAMTFIFLLSPNSTPATSPKSPHLTNQIPSHTPQRLPHRVAMWAWNNPTNKSHH
jgi:hypothetical protein